MDTRCLRSRAGLRLLCACLFSAAPLLAPQAATAQRHVTDDLRRSAIVRTVERVAPAVVGVYTEGSAGGFQYPMTGDPFFDQFFGDYFRAPRRGNQRARLSQGSGVIVDGNGTVITNQHVIVGGDTIKVVLADNREFEAELIGGDSDFDLAVLKIDADADLPYLPIGTDDSILIGETVIAIGNPYGLDHTVTTGVVSAIGRTLQTSEITYQDIIQTDTSINPGNSGGPLLDINGRLIGINTAIHREAQGIGFAIPVWRVRNVVDQILTHGSVLPTWLGLQTQNITGQVASHLGVRPGTGVVVTSVEEGSPAAVAGIEAGDIITRVRGNSIRNSADYEGNVRGLAAGERLPLTVLRDGQERVVELTISPLPARLIDSFAWDKVGLEVADAGQDDGARVTRVRRGSPAAKIGFEPGDIIVGIGGRDVVSAESFRKQMASARGSRNLLLSVLRGRRIYRVAVPLGQ
ncbi:MAG TPA: trypsin-like peptidase domain-containing protein [Candidatus Limnocylindrales bacterium]|nr:trypsin-like peptidase domain-containing protein [Candidatus Limnocylindrales bacterium]